jgi:hypothetical protein
MFVDVLGLNLTTDSAVAVEAYNAAVSDYFEYRLSAGERAKAALAADPTFVIDEQAVGRAGPPELGCNHLMRI